MGNIFFDNVEIPFNSLQMRKYPSWLFDEHSLRIIDANKAAEEFCMYDNRELIGIHIRDLWHDEDLRKVLEDIEINSSEWSFFGNLKHKKKNGEVVDVRVRATRQVNPSYVWEVHLVP